MPPSDEGGDWRWKALAVCLAAVFMTLLDVSIVNVALPSIQEGLHAPDSALQWIVSGYALTYGLMLVPGGRLGDTRSRRAVFMSGLAGFTAASAVAGLAPSVPWLIAARLVQGASAGFLAPQAMGLVQQHFHGAERGRAFGAHGAVVGIAMVIGPLLGGLLIVLGGSKDGWRWVFSVNVPVGVVTLPLAWKLLPAPVRSGQRGFDPFGAALLGTGVTAVILPLLQGQRHAAASWFMVPLGVVVLAGFVQWELRTPAPLVDLSLFRNRSYALGTSLNMVYFAGLSSIFFLLTVFLQNGRGYSPLQTGLTLTPFALGSAVTAFLSGRAATRSGRPMVVSGLSLVLLGSVGTWLAVVLAPGRGLGWAMATPLLVTGLGSGLVVLPNQALALSEIPFTDGGLAAGVLQTGSRLGDAAGIAGVSAVFFASLANTQGDWTVALRQGFTVITALVLTALAIGLYDLHNRSPAHAQDKE